MSERFDIELAKRLYRYTALTPEETVKLLEWGYHNDCLQRPRESTENYLMRLRRTKTLKQ